MKTRALRSYLCFTLLATAFLLGLAGCDKEESEPLRIGDDSFNNIEILFRDIIRRRHEVWLWCLMAFMRISWISLQMTIPKWKVYTPCRLSVRFSDLECMGEPA